MTQEQATNQLTLILFQSLFTEECIGNDEDGNPMVGRIDSKEALGYKMFPTNEAFVQALRTIADRVERGSL